MHCNQPRLFVGAVLSALYALSALAPARAQSSLAIHGMVDAAAWDPAVERWRALPPAPVPVTGLARYRDAWTGTEVVTWAAPAPSADGRWPAPAGSTDGRPVLLDPVTGTWSVGDMAPGGGRQDAPATWVAGALVWWSGEPTEGDQYPSACCDPAPTGATFAPVR